MWTRGQEALRRPDQPHRRDGYGAAILYQFGGGAIVDAPGGWPRMLALLLAASVQATASTVWFAVQDARLAEP